MERLLSAEQMKKADTHAIEELGIPSAVLMERAALAVQKSMEEAGFDLSEVLVVCGSGNNGGDGFALARLLDEQGVKVTLAFVGNDSSMTGESALQRRICENIGLTPSEDYAASKPTTIVDAIFGIGLNRPVSGRYAEVIEWINAQDAKVVSVDIPSGISADSGQLLGCAVKADLTVTMAAKKIGQMLYPGSAFCGELVCCPIGVPVDEASGVTLCTRADLAMLPDRIRNSNKGSYGKVLLIAGSEGMSGAALLSARAALRTGCGMVRVFTPACNRVIVQSALPEALVSCYDSENPDPALLKSALDWSTVVGIGPGLGQSKAAAALLEAVLSQNRKPLVIDADALNLLSSHPALLEKLPPKSILTPHVGEMARLCRVQNEEVSGHLLLTARTCAARLDSIVVLKDARTAVSDGQRLHLNSSGNSGMATAGSGDVLTGVICALLAEGMEPYRAAVLGVYLHGLAGDLARERRGSYGMIASEIADCVGDVMAKAKGEL